jgi:hypothetical protein
LLNVLNQPFNEIGRIIDEAAQIRREVLDEIHVCRPSGTPEIAAESLSGV